VGVDIQADNSISGNAKDINIQNARQVISSVTTDNAIGGQNTTTYKYTRSSKPSPFISISIECSPFSWVRRFFQFPLSPTPKSDCHCLPLSKPLFDRNPTNDQQGLYVYLNTGHSFDSGKQWQTHQSQIAIVYHYQSHDLY
jgi:hypothetical protein